jgi:hypothetical protein
MALHRDIYWVGRQWAVTGNGVQACDQKQKSQFDIELGRLWDDDVVERLRANQWLNIEDLEKALSIARQRFPEPPRKLERTGSETIAPSEPLPKTRLVAKPEAPKPAKPEPAKPAKLDAIKPPLAAPVAPQASATAQPEPKSPEPVAAKFHIRFFGRAKFIRPWRVGSRK